MGRQTVYLVTSDGLGSMGSGGHEFALEMLDKLFHTLESCDPLPHAICFYTDGVKVACRGSELVPSLKLLQGMGVRIILCQSCLQHFNILEKVEVGVVGSMHEIVAVLSAADSVITV